ncbi:MAG: magnesium-protoporphyrin IX monomethyl ester (oxidative) cyclase, partial [Rhodobacter sp.]|nr:magnesium-protoporphyrin IX monomethyl ester (oxidative) cyclase [Rhodobacter sp.]
MNATPMNIHADPDEAGFAATDTTAMATETTLLNPRFYTTDFDEMDRIDVTPVRPAWDKLIAQMKSDPNKGH